MTREAAVGVAVLTGIVCAIGLATGWYGLLYLGLALVIAVISIRLFTGSSFSKSAAVVLNTDLIYKILMPRKYKRAIGKLRDKESAK